MFISCICNFQITKQKVPNLRYRTIPRKNTISYKCQTLKRDKIDFFLSVSKEHTCLISTNTCMHAYTHAHTHTHTCIHMHTYMHTTHSHTHQHIHHTYTYTQIHIYTHPLPHRHTHARPLLCCLYLECFFPE